MIYLKASVKGTAEKAIAGMLFDGTMYEQAIAELTQRFGNPALISKSLINKFLEMSAVQDERWYIRRDLRDVFPGHRNSGPHSCSGHYLTLEKLPSSPSVYTT